MGYTPEEYELLKEFYKRDWRERRILLEEIRLRRLRQRAEWHLSQMESSLQAMGLSAPDPFPPSSPPTPSSDKTLL